MIEKIKQIREKILDIIFPKFCISCKKEGSYLCEDCKSTIEILDSQYCLCKKPKRLKIVGKCQECQKNPLDGLYAATNYKNNLVKSLIKNFKYEPFFAKEITKELADLILDHLMLSEVNLKEFEDFYLLPVPLEKSREKWRGFNQSEEIAKILSLKLNSRLFLENPIKKIKKTLPQSVLSEKERKQLIKGTFKLIDKKSVKNKKIIIIDDVYTTGATLQEISRILKKSGAKQVFGMVVAREFIEE